MKTPDAVVKRAAEAVAVENRTDGKNGTEWMSLSPEDQQHEIARVEWVARAALDAVGVGDLLAAANDALATMAALAAMKIGIWGEWPEFRASMRRLRDAIARAEGWKTLGVTAPGTPAETGDSA